MTSPRCVTKKQQDHRYRTIAKRKAQFYVSSEEWFLLTFSLRDKEIADILDVNQSTVHRWRTGKSRIPFMAAEIMRLRRKELPTIFGDFAGIKCDGKRMWFQDYHYTEGIQAKDIRNWWIIRQMIEQKLSD